MLRTAYCKNNNQLENIDSIAMLSKTNRNQQASSTAYDYMPPITRAGSQLGKTEASPDHTTVEKSGRAKQHWDLVCTRKYQVIMNKQQHMKELLNKKFNQEKAFKKRMDDEEESRLYDLQQRAERFKAQKLRKEMDEQNMQKQRNQELKLSNQKTKQAEERRVQAHNYGTNATRDKDFLTGLSTHESPRRRDKSQLGMRPGSDLSSPRFNNRLAMNVDYVSEVAITSKICELE